ncbi:MAG TPA: tyrosine-type recombinase/integrase [Candidatus Binatia bacterium]|jgi:integrase/recombinase XerD|nr:tyrosine-type recombinase/integrase [Candidatus Binatia bacterium]
MNNIYSNPTPLRQKFIEYLTLNRKAERTVHAYVSFIYALAKYYRRSPELLGPQDLQHWLYHLIAERKQAASTVNLAINAVRSFYGGMLQRDIEALLRQIKRPKRPTRAPRVYSMAEIERLLTLGTEGNLRARAFLSCVYGGGLRLSEATHIRIKDLDSDRQRLLVSHPKGQRQRYTLLSANLLVVLRQYYRQAHPKDFLFPGDEPLQPMSKGTGQSIFYGAVARSGLPDRGGIHCLRHSFATHCLENGIEITVVQTLLGHASLHTTAGYLHVRAERLAQIQSPLGLLDLKSPLIPS